MHAVWSGRLRFHSMKIAIQLYPAVRKQKQLLHAIHETCHSRITIEKKCPVHGTILPDETANGYRLKDDQYIVLDRNDLHRIKPPTSRRFKISGFISKTSLDPIDFVESYYMVPHKSHQNQYAILRESLRHAGLYGIGKILIRRSERLAALWVKEQLLVVSTLLHFDERNNRQILRGKMVDLKIKKEDIRKTENLIKRHQSCLDTLMHEDSYYERILDLLGQKIVRIASANELGFASETEWSAQQESQDIYERR